MQRTKYLAILAMFVIVLALQVIPAQAFSVSAYTRLYEGIEYATGYTTSPRLMRAFATRVSLRNPDVWVYASHDNGGSPYETALQTTPDFVTDHGLKVATNTCFYDAGLSPNTDILGLLISNGVLVSPVGSVPEAQMCFDSLKTASLVVRNYNPTGFYNGCGTGDMVLTNGVIVGPQNDLQPRTALGLSQDGKYLIFVVVDGRQPDWSDGATWYDVGQWLIDFGAYNGATYDGGGSTCMTIAGYGDYVNRPCYRYARAVGANLGAGSAAVGVVGPDVCAKGANRIDLIIRGNLNNPYVKTWTSSGGWGTPVNLTGATYYSPAICWWNTNSVAAFVRGAADNQLYVNMGNGTTWSGWGPAGGVMTSGPAAVSWGPNRIDVFIRSTDNALWHQYYNGSAWSGWETLGGVLAGDPAVCSWQAGRLDVFVRGGDNALWHRYYNGAWSIWESLGGVLTSDPAAVSWGPGRIDVFARSTDNGLWHQSYYNAWSGWETLGGVLASSPAVCSRGSGKLDVFLRGPNDHLYQRSYDNAWGAFIDLGSYF